MKKIFVLAILIALISTPVFAGAKAKAVEILVEKAVNIPFDCPREIGRSMVAESKAGLQMTKAIVTSSPLHILIDSPKREPAIKNMAEFSAARIEANETHKELLDCVTDSVKK